MGWTGNSTANWEMGWEMGYFKTIPGNGWEMGRVKMGEHCFKHFQHSIYLNFHLINWISVKQNFPSRAPVNFGSPVRFSDTSPEKNRIQLPVR